MVAEKPTEMTYASDLKEILGQIIRDESLPFGQVKVEMIKDHKRADILVYDRQNQVVLIIEVKRPEEVDAPYDPSVLEQAGEYAESYQSSLKHIATHNVNFLVLWDVVTFRRVDQFAITYVRELDEYLRKMDEIKDSYKRFLRWYTRLLAGEPPKPIDESIVEVLNGYITGIANSTSLVNELTNRYVTDQDFRKKFLVWLADNGWPDPRGDKKVLEARCIVLAKQYLYLFMNKVLFYNVLKDKYTLPDLTLPKGLSSETFRDMLLTYFETMAMKKSGDYETVFQTNFVDNLPTPLDTITELTKVARYLSTLDYATLGYDIIGKTLEKLIPEKERHALGQYFTRSDVVDMILGFCVKQSSTTLLDPGCGSGTFLVRAYYRLKYLDNAKTHADLLNQIWGIDISKFPAHLSTINLAIRDLSSKHNYPNVIYNDFFKVAGPESAVRIGVQNTLHAFGVPATSTAPVEVKGLDRSIAEREIPKMGAVVGNPPYTRQEEMLAEYFGQDYKKDTLLPRIQQDFAKLDFSLRASIYAYFFVHGLKFLDEGGRLGFISLRSWLDVAYGDQLKRFLLEHTKIVAVIESKDEKWFEEAQMLPCATIVEQCESREKRDSNLVRFVQLKCKVSEFIPPITDERDLVQEINRWQRVDEFAKQIEAAEKEHKFKTIEFLDKKIHLYEDEKIRIVMFEQRDLKEDPKWGKYLGAPSAFFKLIEQAKDLLTPLYPKVAKVLYAIKTGANEFFCLPNRFFTIREEGDYIVLVDKGTEKDRFWIEKEYAVPVLNKIKPHKSIGNLKKDGFLLWVRESKSELRKKGKKVLKYIEYGENKEHVWRNITWKGYNERPTCKSHSPWYAIENREKAPILSPSIFWGRYLMFWNPKKFFGTDCLDEIHPRIKKHQKALCAILNSTLTALFVEFSGRNIENRDKTISNEVKIYELRKLPVLDPAALEKKEPKLIQKLEDALDGLLDREVKPVFDEVELADRRELDRIILKDILGLSKDEISEIWESTGQLYRDRIERLSTATEQGEAEEE